jgi:hypothetical protein
MTMKEKIIEKIKTVDEDKHLKKLKYIYTLLCELFQ